VVTGLGGNLGPSAIEGEGTGPGKPGPYRWISPTRQAPTGERSSRLVRGIPSAKQQSAGEATEGAESAYSNSDRHSADTATRVFLE
jgi:hypothetical protein